MGRIRKTLAWTFSPGGDMRGPVRAESSAERAAREAAEAQQVQARDQLRLLAAGPRRRPRSFRPARAGSSPMTRQLFIRHHGHARPACHPDPVREAECQSGTSPTTVQVTVRSSQDTLDDLRLAP